MIKPIDWTAKPLQSEDYLYAVSRQQSGIPKGQYLSTYICNRNGLPLTMLTIDDGTMDDLWPLTIVAVNRLVNQPSAGDL